MAETKLKNQALDLPNYAFSATKGSSQDNIAGNTNVKATFPSENFDVGSCYDAANSRFVAPVDGLYHFSFNLSWYNVAADTLYQGQLWVNGSQKHAHKVQSAFGGATHVVNNMSVLLKLSEGDYVEVYAYTGDTTNTSDLWYTNPNAFFSGFYVGEDS